MMALPPAHIHHDTTPKLLVSFIMCTIQTALACSCSNMSFKYLWYERNEEKKSMQFFNSNHHYTATTKQNEKQIGTYKSTQRLLAWRFIFNYNMQTIIGVSTNNGWRVSFGCWTVNSIINLLHLIPTGTVWYSSQILTTKIKMLK